MTELEFDKYEDAKDYIFKYYDWFNLIEYQKYCDDYIFEKCGKYIVPLIGK